MKKRILILIIVIVLTIGLACGIFIGYKKSLNNDKKQTEAVKKISAIEEYGYSLTDADGEYYKGLFQKLENTLEAEEIDYELYATLVSQLFTTDFYTLSNKLSSSDVGGLEFVLESIRDNFAAKAKDTMYKSIKSNLYGDRDQQLPTVTKASVDDISDTKYTYNDEKVDAYNVKVSLTYSEDMGYPSTVKLLLIKNDKKLEIVKVD